MASKELHVVGFPSYLDIVFIIFILLLAAFMYLYRTIALIDTFLYDFDKRPRLSSLYFKGLCRGVLMKQGKLYDGDADAHAVQIYARKCRVDVGHLRLYKAVCGYPHTCKIPVYYMECFSIPVVTTLVTSSKFRLSPLGLIHIREVTDQYEDILVGTYNVSAKVSEYRETERGVEVDIKVETFNEDEICVVKSIVTLLSRSKAAQKGGGRKTHPETAEEGDSPETIAFEVPPGIGVKYARVSGDYNPHHLYKLTAKVFGFKSPIAPGMWTVAHTLAELHKNGFVQLGAPLHVEAFFKRPLFIPGDVLVKHTMDSSEDGCTFRVENKDTKEPHVIGSISNTAKSVAR
ncbi:3-hydroxyacyl-thioester dehydratase X-like [Lineus longissimus]|uniref:3-hydroxyacyl-thioester dehydratase X-like n=1 Tax=Lineus longissimus TaxID=88925 RepID=UPI002B4F6DD5